MSSHDASCNRVTPRGDIVAAPLRCRWMGNRGRLHEGDEIVRPWNGRRWITCETEFRGWRAEQWAPNHYTVLFLYDEAVAFAAGHRPCALCRHSDYGRYREAWASAFRSRETAEQMDRRLHDDRLDGRAKRRHVMSWDAVPSGAFVELDGVAALVTSDALRLWDDDSGYTSMVAIPRSGRATLLTPAANIAVLQHGYQLDR
jgi:hypothetical protein